jgi:hypothetical protein
MTGPDELGPPMTEPRNHPGLAVLRNTNANRWMWLAIVVATVVGAVLWATLSTHPQNAMWSYLGGMALAVGAFELGVFNIRMADRYMPSLTLAVAVFSYATTAIALALVLAASSPHVVDGPGISTGLFAGVFIWTAGLIARTWVRPERSDTPVNITLRDEFPTNTP